MLLGKKLTKGLFPALLSLVVIIMVACGSGGNGNGNGNGSGVTKAPASQQIFVSPEAGVSDIATFDPGLSTDFPSITAIDMVFTGLVQLNDKLQVIPQEAQSYTLGSDGLTWTFHLRPNLKFSDGTALTSTDVAYSIDRALQPSEKSPVGPIYLALIKDSDKLVAGKIKTVIGDSVMTPDPNTVVLVANKKASYFLDALTYSCSYTIEKSIVTKYGKTFADHLTEGGGDGPWKVSKYAHGQEIDFVPNPDYYGPKPQMAEVKFPFYKQADTTYRAYQVGQVDTSGVPSANLAAAKTLPNGQYHAVPQLTIFYFTMNYLVKPFDNIDIRQAMDLAIDKNLIASSVYKGSVIPTNHIVPQGMPGYNPNLKAPDGTQTTSGDVTKAKQLLQAGMQQEGYSSVSQLPAITYTYPSGSTDTDNEIAAEVQMWQSNLGISVKPQPIDFNKLLDETEAAINNPHGLQMWWLGWIADYPDPQDWTTLQFDKGVPNNQWNYGQNNTSDAAMQQQTQQLLEQADVNPDNTSRMQQYMQAEQQLVNDVAWAPIFQSELSFVLKPYVKGLVFNPQNLTPPNDWANVYIASH